MHTETSGRSISGPPAARPAPQPRAAPAALRPATRRADAFRSSGHFVWQHAPRIEGRQSKQSLRGRAPSVVTAEHAVAERLGGARDKGGSHQRTGGPGGCPAEGFAEV